MTEFADFEFPVTGGTTDRTLPERLSDIANVKDWGATGNGSTDDWQFIQNAIDRNHVDLTVAALVPGVDVETAVRATCTATVSAGVVTALTIGANGTQYKPGQVYTITFSGGGGSGAAATATANGSGVINSGSLAITNGGSSYETAPTCAIEFPGHITTITFNSVPSNIATYRRRIHVLKPGTAVIHGATVINSSNVGAGTVTMQVTFIGIGLSGNTTPNYERNTSVVNGDDLEVGDVVRFCTDFVGDIFFPSGTYRVSEPINLLGGETPFNVYGCGNTSKIIGDFPDFVLKRRMDQPYSSASGGTKRISNLSIENEDPLGGGIAMGVSVGGAINDCKIVANRGITTMNQDTLEGGGAWGSFEISITNCDLSPGAHVTDSYGLFLSNDGPTLNCRVVGYERGWILVGGQGGQMLAGCHFELCETAIRAGLLPDGTSYNTLAYAIVGNTFKDCGMAAYDPSALFAANTITAAQGAFAGDSQYGIYADDALGSTVIAANYIEGWYDIASFYVQGLSAQPDNNLFVSNYVDTNPSPGTEWTTVANPGVGRFIENNVTRTYSFTKLQSRHVTNATWSTGTVTLTTSTAHNMTSALYARVAGIKVGGSTANGYNGDFDLTSASGTSLGYAVVSNPGSADADYSQASVIVIGAPGYGSNVYFDETWNITDSSVTTWGSSAAGSGSGHVKVRWNGSDWTVVGK